jgi:hypothetical protein
MAGLLTSWMTPAPCVRTGGIKILYDLLLLVSMGTMRADHEKPHPSVVVKQPDGQQQPQR